DVCSSDLISYTSDRFEYDLIWSAKYVLQHTPIAWECWRLYMCWIGIFLQIFSHRYYNHQWSKTGVSYKFYTIVLVVFLLEKHTTDVPQHIANGFFLSSLNLKAV